MSYLRFMRHWVLLAWQMRKDAWAARSWPTVCYLFVGVPTTKELILVVNALNAAIGTMGDSAPSTPSHEEDPNAN